MGQFQPTPEGETPWTYISYPVSPGEYNFTWSYVKDGGGGSTDMEEDCTWIDVVEFPPTVGGPSTINIELNKEMKLYFDLSQISIFDKNSKKRI